MSATPPTDIGTKLIALGVLSTAAAASPVIIAAYYVALAIRVVTR